MNKIIASVISITVLNLTYADVPVNPLQAPAKNQNRLLHILPVNGERVMQIPIASISLDDGLNFNYFLSITQALDFE